MERKPKTFSFSATFSGSSFASLPFSAGDVTAGSETELQTAVVGPRERVDLPLTIENSNFFANVLRRVASGDTSRSIITDLEHYLQNNPDNVWENSWVRFPYRMLSPRAEEVFRLDTRADKRNPDGEDRSDLHKFMFHQDGEEYLRLPVSYLLKLALADVADSQPKESFPFGKIANRLMERFSNDNTSPETVSFYVPALRSEEGTGHGLARETLKRFLLTQFLAFYANQKFGLQESGQEVMVYSSPHPPLRQKLLNDCVSDSFYRDLFMSPCLSGWDEGEAKKRYMHLCHEVLSRSQLNGVAKLREAGIITRNLIVMPNISNISLANNGTHISIGSRTLTEWMAEGNSGDQMAKEKYMGDLVIKVVEHFLPLFVGTLSAAPYRLDFTEFHPETVLSFLPHELDFTHLRMIWRRWKKKGRSKFLGHPITPFGPKHLDRFLRAIFRLKGDSLLDFRIINYLCAVMSTDQSPALNGVLGNQESLGQDLEEMGVFHSEMPLYMLYRQRHFNEYGFSGFEGRHYSLFHKLGEDTARAVELQTLVTALAYRYVLEEKVRYGDIPNEPFYESERRQIFFGTAIGIPTFYVRKDTKNRFLKKILELTEGTRSSRRYPGYYRIYNIEYRRALLRLLEQDGEDLIQSMRLQGTMVDLRERIDHPNECSTAGKLKRGITELAGVKSEMKLRSEDFNRCAEKYYREGLRNSHLAEGFECFEADLIRLIRLYGHEYREALHAIAGEADPVELLNRAHRTIQSGEAPLDTIRKLIQLLLLSIHHDIRNAERSNDGKTEAIPGSAPVCGPTVGTASN